MREPCRAFASRAITTVLLATAGAGVASSQQYVYSGRAFGAACAVSTMGQLRYADTGTLPVNGGWLGETLPVVDVPSKLHGAIATAATRSFEAAGSEREVVSESSTADVVLLPGHRSEIRASFVRAACRITAAGAVATSEIHDLSIGGRAIAVTGAPNQRVGIPGVGLLVINEQLVTNDGSGTTATVNGLRLWVSLGGSIVVSNASGSRTVREGAL